MCTMLDLSGGTLAGMACGIQKRFGAPSSSVLGGQQFYLRVTLLAYFAFLLLQTVPHCNYDLSACHDCARSSAGE